MSVTTEGTESKAALPREGLLMTDICRLVIDTERRGAVVAPHGTFVAHSCDPNCVLVRTSQAENSGRLVTLRPLAPEEEPTINVALYTYSHPPFQCNCESKARGGECFEQIEGFKGFPDAAKDKLLIFCEDNVRDAAFADGWRVTTAENADAVEVLPQGGIGVATFAKRDIQIGEVAFEVRGPIIPFATKFTLMLDERRHIIGGVLSQCVAHSCEANTQIVVTPDGLALHAVARRPISRGEIISFDYNSNEWDMATPFSCLCATPSCVGNIAGFKNLAEAEQVRLLPQCTPWILELYKTEITKKGSV